MSTGRLKFLLWSFYVFAAIFFATPVHIQSRILVIVRAAGSDVFIAIIYRKYPISKYGGDTSPFRSRRGEKLEPNWCHAIITEVQIEFSRVYRLSSADVFWDSESSPRRFQQSVFFHNEYTRLCCTHWNQGVAELPIQATLSMTKSKSLLPSTCDTMEILYL